jgi:hypothetical protein
MDLGTDFRSAFRLAHSSGEILERNPSSVQSVLDENDFLELLKVYHRYKASEDIWNDLKAAVKEAKTLFVLKSMTESARKSFEKECTKEVSSWCMDDSRQRPVSRYR